jgi:hypothetical protein
MTSLVYGLSLSAICLTLRLRRATCWHGCINVCQTGSRLLATPLFCRVIRADRPDLPPPSWSIWPPLPPDAWACGSARVMSLSLIDSTQTVLVAATRMLRRQPQQNLERYLIACFRACPRPPIMGPRGSKSPASRQPAYQNTPRLTSPVLSVRGTSPSKPVMTSDRRPCRRRRRRRQPLR